MPRDQFPVTLSRMSITGAERFPKARLPVLPLLPGARVFEDWDNGDYVYCREELATLTGRFYEKTQSLNQCWPVM